MILAIHQPNFFPWYPYFQKMRYADIFVFLTHCQFEKNYYINRFNLDGWHTMSVSAKTESINDKKYLNPEYDWMKIKKRLRNYNLEGFDKHISEGLANTNIAIIKEIARTLGIKTRLETDWETDLTGTERLIDICKAHKADTYLSGHGAKKYMDLNLFGKHNIKVLFCEHSWGIQKDNPIVQRLQNRFSHN